jgi:drug/metabolite transporter (DMT)-like permease
MSGALPANEATHQTNLGAEKVNSHQASIPPSFWRMAQGFAWGSLSVAILSGWFVVTRLGFRHDLRVWDVIALRFGEGAVLLTPALLVGPSRLQLQAWSQGIALAVLWGAPFILLVGIGLQATSATLTSTVTPALMPVFAGFIAWTLLGERPHRHQLYGFALIFVGLLALVYGYIRAEGWPDIGGAAALVMAAAMWALYTMRLRRTGLTSLQAAGLIFFWSAILYLPLYLGIGLPNLIHASGGELLFQSICQGISVVSIFGFNRAVALLGPRAAAAIIALVPVTATLFAMPVLSEWPSWLSGTAICIIALGVMMAAASTKPANIKGESL